MKKNLVRQSACLAAAALILAAGLTAGKAMAYFTTYAAASGTVPMTMGRIGIDVEEEVDDLTKYVVVTNTGDYDCYIRVRALAGETCELTYKGEKWTDGGDGYYYYDDIVTPEGLTEPILVTIKPPAGTESPKDDDGFNVVVVAECSPVFDGQQGPQWTAASTGEGE